MRFNCCFKFLYEKEFEKQNKNLVEKLNDEEENETDMNDLTNPMIPEVTEIPDDLESSKNPKNSKIGIENLNLEKYFPDQHIEELINYYQTQLATNPEKNYKKLTTTKKKNLLDLKVYAKFSKKENSSNNLHHCYAQMTWNYKPENILYFDLNNPKIINNKVAISKYLNIHKSKNGIIRYIKYTKSKKILIIQPRHTLDIYAIKKLDDGSYIEIGSCITKTDLKENPDVIEYMKNIDKELFVSNLISVNQYFVEDDRCKQKMFKISDPNTSVGFMLLKGVIKSSSVNYYKKFEEALEVFFKEVLEGKIDLYDDEGFPFLKELRESVGKEYLICDKEVK